MKALGLVACAALACAQTVTSPTPEIRGTVLEFGTRFGLAGAQVSLLTEGQTQPLATTTTDSGGVFVFRPSDFGHYDVKLSLAGYQPAGLSDVSQIGDTSNIVGTEAHVVITKGNPKEELHFTLVQPAEIRGRVVDEETGVPLSKIPVAPVAPKGMMGLPTPGFGKPVLTDDDGQFVIPSVRPGSYAVEVLPRILGEAQILTQFSEDDLKAVDQDIEKTFSPGGRELNAAGLIPVGSGQSVSVGTIKVRQAPYFRIRARFPAINCPTSEKAHVQLGPPSIAAVGDRVTGDVPCGSDFLIRNVQPGSYRLQVLAGRTPETRAQGSILVDMRDRNVDVIASLDRGVDVDGRIVVADDVPPPPLNELTVMVQLLDGMVFGSPPLTPGQDGSFRIVNAPLGRQSVEILRASRGYYLREIRYNGVVQPERAFTLDGNSPAHLLELVIDNQPAAITGIVEDHDNPVLRPYVVVAHWPFDSGMMNLSVHKASGDNEGKFRFLGLSPGDYRVLAVTEADKDKLSEPGVLDRLLPAAEKVTLDRGGVQDLHLKLTDPNR